MKNCMYTYKPFLLVMLFGIYCNAMEHGFLQYQKELLVEKVNQASSQFLAQNSRFTPNVIVYKGSPHKRTLETSGGHFVYVPHAVAKESTLLRSMLQCKKDKQLEPGKLACDAESLVNVIKLSRQKNNIDEDNCGPFLEIASYLGLPRKKMIPAACYYLNTIRRDQQEEHIRNIALKVAPCISDMSENQLKDCIEQTEVNHNNSSYQHINLSNRGLYSLRGLDRFIALCFFDTCTFNGKCSKNCINTIRSISFKHNNLTSFDPSLFYGFQELREIDVSYNNITRFDDVVLYHNVAKRKYHYCYNYLEKISLAHNKLTEVDQSLCAHYPYLLDIDLSDNAITSLKKGDFTGLNKKGIVWEEITINVSNNQIKSIEKGAFKKFFNGTINLDNNRLNASQINKMQEFFKLSRLHRLGKYLSKNVKDTVLEGALRIAALLCIAGCACFSTYKVAHSNSSINKSTTVRYSELPIVFLGTWLLGSNMYILLEKSLSIALSSAHWNNATTMSAKSQKN